MWTIAVVLALLALGCAVFDQVRVAVVLLAVIHLLGVFPR